MRRRTFLRTIVVAAGGAALGRALPACEGGGGDPLATFPQSVASGDPRPDSIVLWTRVVPADASRDARVRLELALDEGFASPVAIGPSDLVASPEHDHCLRVKVTGLLPGTRYYYRFEHAGTRSRVGRFRTSPAPDADVPVRFALLSCQDRIGRYYNTLLKLLEPEQDDLDFVVHLGDYVYETTGDPSFMSASAERQVQLTDVEGAIAREEDGHVFYAARSLDNYRELYRIYRSDPILQRVHERFAFVVTWDDHEFSDDSWQDVATYDAGRSDERDTERRRNADQAFFEYAPVARDGEDEGALDVDPSTLFPATRLYRDFRFGRHAHLVMLDYRSFRPDHPIPESAWPGAIAATEERVRTALEARERDGRLPSGVTADVAFAEGGYRPYVDLTNPTYERHARAARMLLAAAYEREGASAERAAALAEEATAGGADVTVLNALIESGRASLPADLRDVAAIDEMDPGLPRGISYQLLGKRSLFGSVGSRYFVVARHYDLWSETREASAGGGDDPLGAEQRAFLETAIGAHADATWTIVGSSVSLAPLQLDLTSFASRLPPCLPAEIYYLNVDHWDGFPTAKRRLLSTVLRPRNALVLSGDIHASYVVDHGADAMGRRAVEITTPAVSSSSFRGLLYNAAQALPSLRGNDLVDVVLTALDFLLTSARPEIRHAQSDIHGVTIARVDGNSLEIDVWTLPPDLVVERFYERAAELAGRWGHTRLRVSRSGGVNGPVELVAG